MFTGIIEETGKVASLEPAGRLTVEAGKVLEGTARGDSIAVSGVCLTVTEMSALSFTVDVSPETLSRSTLGSLERGSPVNLERAMVAGGRMGGHIVQGHVDGVGAIKSRKPLGNAVLFEISVPAEIERYVVPKGSVAIDGISLTAVETRGGVFSVSIIPRTLAETTLERARPGWRVNIEVDIIAKYVEAFLSRGKERAEDNPGIEDALRRGGFYSPEGV